MYVERHLIADDLLEEHFESRTPVTPIALPKPTVNLEPPSRYTGTSSRSAILFIAIAHAALIAALIKLDVVHVAPRRAAPILIDIRPPAALPAAQPLPKQAVALPKVATPVVAPSPMVAVPVAPSVIAAVAPAPPAPVPQPAPVAAAPAIVAAPIIPPDSSAATLGNPALRYPIESRRAREEGTVRLRVLISPDGVVEEISVARSSGYDRLDKAALDAVRRFRFKPGTQAGKPVEAVGYLSIPFVLSH